MGEKKVMLVEVPDDILAGYAPLNVCVEGWKQFSYYRHVETFPSGVHHLATLKEPTQHYYTTAQLHYASSKCRKDLK